MTDRDLLHKPSEEDEKLELVKVLSVLFSISSNQPLLAHKFTETFFKYRQFCVAEFYRQYYSDKTFKHHTLPNRYKSIVELEVKLWITVYQLIQEVCRYYPGFYKYPAHWFLQIINERKLVLFRAFKNSENLNKGGYLKEIRNRNERLWTLEGNPYDQQTANAPPEDNPNSIPFDRQTEPHTWRLIRYAMSLVEQKNGFKKQFYTPMVEARRAMTSKIAASGVDVLVPSKYGNGAAKKNRGGRPPKNKKSSS